MAEESDSLRSQSFAQIIDLVSEGEIEGLADGMKSVFLNDTPILAPDGTANFTGVSVDSRNGTNGQTAVQGFLSAENEVNVGVEVKASAAIIRTISSANVNAVNVRISFPQMTFQDLNTGNISGSTVQLKIETNSNNAGWVQRANDQVIGKCTSKFVKSYRINLPATGPHQVRVTRISADETLTNIQNKTFWDSYAEIVDVKLRYPNSAIMAVSVDASNFQTIPTRSYDLKLLKIQVPTNYDPITRDYTGIWDGTFQTLWSDNPAWVFYDLVTANRYGLGQHIDASLVDKWGLYEIAQYCDELLLDGSGGYEPRFSCNVYFQERSQAYNLINDLAGVFRAVAYWSSGLLTLSQDSPKDPSHLFTASNVINGDFQYQGTSRQNRYTVALVTWNDPEDNYRPKVEYVEDASAILKYGVIESQVVAIGCSSRGQAHRFGKWVIYTSQMETETVTFQTGIEAAALRPGQIIKVQDDMRAGQRLGGRVSTATTSTVTIDQDLSLAAGSYTLSVMLPGGTVESKQIDHIAGRVVTITSTFSQTPHNQSVWMISSSILEPQTFRVISVNEDKGIYSVTALAYDEAKFDFIENGLVLPARSISSLTVVPDAPSDLKVTESLYEVSGEVRVKATFSWGSVLNAGSYTSRYRATNGNFINLGEHPANEAEILNVEPGQYEFFVTAISSLGQASSESSIPYQVLGKAYPPGNVLNFSLIPMAGSAYLSWDKSVDLDVLIGGSVRIRFSPNLGDNWKNSVDLAVLSGSSTRAQVPLQNGTYLAKFVDSSDKPSVTEATIETSALEASVKNYVANISEDPSFSGSKTTMMLSSFYGGLCIDANSMIDDWTGNVDDILAWDFIGGVAPTGTYYFANAIDLTAIYTVTMVAYMSAQAVDISDRIDWRLDSIDSWTDLDGAFIDDVNATIYVRTTTDDPGASPTWTDWKPFFVGDYKCRGIQFKVVATSTATNHNIVIQNLVVSVDMPDRTIHVAGAVSSTGGDTIVFEKPFAAVPSIGITAQNMATGDYFVVSSKTVSGFSVIFKNSGGSGVARTYDYIAKGYGRQM